MTVKDILALTDYDTTISLCFYDIYGKLKEAAVISPDTSIRDYTRTIEAYGSKDVKTLRVDMTDTLTIIYNINYKA